MAERKRQSTHELVRKGDCLNLNQICRKNWGVAALAALAAGFFTHAFALVNIIHNYDDIASLPAGYGGGISLGRWFLELLGRLAMRVGLTYNLGFLEGAAFLILVAVTAGFLVAVLGLHKRSSAAAAGALFAVFPTVSATLFFRYTAPFYGVGLLLAVLSVWVLRKSRYGLVLSALYLCCSMGIYQAYAPVAIGLYVMVLIQEALGEDGDVRSLVRHGLYDCGALLLGVALYFVCLKLATALTGSQLDAYQGISSMGHLGLTDLPKLVWQAFADFFRVTYEDYRGLSGRRLVQLVYAAVMVLTAAGIGWTMAAKRKKPILVAATCVLCLLFPVAVNFISLMVPDGWIYTLMVYAFVLVGCLGLVVAESLPPGKTGVLLTKGLGLAVAALVFCHGYFDNVNYSALYFANRQAENYAASIVTQARMTEGFTGDKQWALLGQIQDPLLHSKWDVEATYGGNSYASHMLGGYSRNAWIENYIGYTLPLVGEERLEELESMEEVKAMPCWPDAGSIRVMEDTVVIKFS